MRKIHIDRLRKVTKCLSDAARSSQLRSFFSMRRFGWGVGEDHPCGTPACVIGNYAARRDLQDKFKLTKYGVVQYVRRHDQSWGRGHHMYIDDEAFCKYFGITEGEAKELFGVFGCDEAESPTEARKYIENFIKLKEKENGTTMASSAA